LTEIQIQDENIHLICLIDHVWWGDSSLLRHHSSFQGQELRQSFISHWWAVHVSDQVCREAQKSLLASKWLQT